MVLARAYRIETQRLVIRCYEPADAGMLHEAILNSLDHLRPWMPWTKEEPKTLESRVDLLRFFRGQFDLGQDYFFGVFDRSETSLLGATGLHTRIGEDAREIGYWINALYLNKGLGTEAVTALIKVGFAVEQLSRVEIRCAPDNVRSQNIPRKLGFQLQQILKHETVDSHGRPRDTMVWVMFRQDYNISPIRHLQVKAYDVLGREIVHT